MMNKAESGRSPLHRPGLLALSLLGALAGNSCAAKQSDPGAFWAEHDDSSTETIDHAAWQTILDGYLRPGDPSGIHLFDYRALKASAADRETLTGYLAYLQELDPRRYSRTEQMAYWINFYNALTVEVVLGGYPVDSIRDIHEGILPLTGPWDDVHATVAGQDLTLNNMEHDILRPFWRDPRIHYAVNCASLGCPNLATRAYTPANLEELLDQGARDYINHPRGVEVLDDSFAVASSIYDWFREDFGETEADVIAHLLRYADADLAEQIEGFDGALEYEYDWSINAAR